MTTGVTMRARDLAEPIEQGDAARLDHFLQTSSRTFALTIPLLRQPTRLEVTVAYLLFRVADTLEDSTRWTPRRKQEELETFARLLENPGEAEAADLARRWAANPPLEHAGYLELLSEFPLVLRASHALSRQAWALIAAHTARTCRAMASFVEREEKGVLRLRDLRDLKAYCYAVAGIVGELLTELFLLDHVRLGPLAGRMRRDASAFGEALQLVNIIKDRVVDAHEGRHYLPRGLRPEAVIALARRDLKAAARYCARLDRAGADRGLIAFTALPLLLARATLDRLESLGAGAKLRRDEVAEIVERLQAALDRGAVRALLGSAQAGSA